MKSHVWAYLIDQAEKTLVDASESVASLEHFRDSVSYFLDLSYHNEWNREVIKRVENEIETAYRKRLFQDIVKVFDRLPKTLEITSLDDCNLVMNTLSRFGMYKEYWGRLHHESDWNARFFTTWFVAYRIRDYFLAALKALIECKSWVAFQRNMDGENMYDRFKRVANSVGVSNPLDSVYPCEVKQPDGSYVMTSIRIPESLESGYNEALLQYDIRKLNDSIRLNISSIEEVRMWQTSLEALRKRWWDVQILDNIGQALRTIQDAINNGTLELKARKMEKF